MAYTPDDLDRMFQEWEQNIKKKDAKFPDDPTFRMDKNGNITMDCDEMKISLEKQPSHFAMNVGEEIEAGQPVQALPNGMVIPAGAMTMDQVVSRAGKKFVPYPSEKCHFCGKDMEERVSGDMTVIYRCNTPGCPNNPDPRPADWESPILKQLEEASKHAPRMSIFKVFSYIFTLVTVVILVMYFLFQYVK